MSHVPYVYGRLHHSIMRALVKWMCLQSTTEDNLPSSINLQNLRDFVDLIIYVGTKMGVNVETSAENLDVENLGTYVLQNRKNYWSRRRHESRWVMTRCQTAQVVSPVDSLFLSAARRSAVTLNTFALWHGSSSPATISQWNPLGLASRRPAGRNCAHPYQLKCSEKDSPKQVSRVAAHYLEKYPTQAADMRVSVIDPEVSMRQGRAQRAQGCAPRCHAAFASMQSQQPSKPGQVGVTPTEVSPVSVNHGHCGQWPFVGFLIKKSPLARHCPRSPCAVCSVQVRARGCRRSASQSLIYFSSPDSRSIPSKLAALGDFVDFGREIW